MNPAIIRAVSKTLPGSSTTVTVSGVIEKSTDKNQVIIKTSSGAIPVNVDSSRFTNGDPVVLTLHNGSFRLEKSGVKIDNIEIDKDIFLKSTATTVRLADILEYLKQSAATGDSLLISENVKTVLDLINDKGAYSGIDKTLLTATLKAISARIEQPGTLSSDAIESLQKLKNILQTIITIKPESELPIFSLAVASTLRNGIHLITTDTLFSLVDNNNIHQQVQKQLDPFRDKSGNIAVRVSGDTQKKIIVPLPDISLRREFQSIITGMKSSLLQSIPPESLESLLTQRGSVEFDTLTNLDNQLVTISSRFPSERAGSRSAAVAVITNWLSQSIDTIDNGEQPVKVPPVLPQSLQNDIESIDTILRKSTMPMLATLSGSGITETTLSEEARPDALPLLFSKLGLDNESKMLHNSTVSSTIKTELLKLLSVCIDNNPVQEYKTVTDQNVRSAVKNLNNFIEFFESNEELTPQTLQQGIAQLVNLKEQLSAIVPPVHLQTVTDNIDKIIKLLADFKSNNSDLMPQLKDKTGILFEMLTAGSEAGKDQSAQQKDTARSELIMQSSANQGADETMFKIRSTVESAINKLESLQLLARQTPIADGSQQQILALPMKIGNEWTELNIRFLKKESSQKRKQSNGSSFNVQINLAPVNLGAVSVKMDYIVKKSLRISMDFEKDTTRDFFQKNNTAIKTAIAELGLPVFSVDIKKSIRKPAIQDEKVLEQLIDVKV
jgi:uncharacterized protein YdeI (BOF family)